jgi:EAL domain-containing protein (putative c-di-GMP-specific phosphodiesterase class I)
LLGKYLAASRLLRDVAQTLKESGLAPQLLELEVAESMVMYNPDKAVIILAHNHCYGRNAAPAKGYRLLH